MIRIFNSAVPGERLVQLDEVNIVSMKMEYDGTPYILFEHKDFPLGGLYATFDGELWQCDMD